jgi:hypothetical protein
MLAIRSICRGTVSNIVLTHAACASPVFLGDLNQLQVRHAGGGGRPGAKPTLNWRKRMELRLNKKGETTKKFKIKEFGDFDTDIAPYLDEAKGDVMLNITEMDEWDLSDHAGSEEDEKALEARMKIETNPYKKIHTSRLFGSNKSAGAILKKENPGLKFSHKRVFGGKA